MQKKRLVLLMILGIFVLGLASCAAVPLRWEEATKTVSLPDDIKIIPPAPDLPKELAAFSGKWTGVWGGYFSSILIIEEINEKEAKIIYAHEDPPGHGERIKAAYKRFTARVISGVRPQIEWVSVDGERTFLPEMQKDLKTIKASCTFLIKGYGTGISRGIFKKAE